MLCLDVDIFELYSLELWGSNYMEYRGVSALCWWEELLAIVQYQRIVSLILSLNSISNQTI
jgi:hypothetical protein